MTRRLAMFPLGSVLLPGTVVPLYLFEPRYLRFYDDVVVKGDEFAIVLIERGSEVGGGDQRFDVGTAARTAAARREASGRFIIAAGTSRIRVVDWLEDDPYPRAVVEDLAESGPPDHELVASCRSRLEDIVALLAEGRSGPDTSLPDGDDDPVAAVYQMAHLAPLQQIDRQRLLEIDDATKRARLLLRLLDDQLELVRFQRG